MWNKQLPFTISNLAWQEITTMMKVKGIDSNYCLRIGAKGAGCAGSSLFLGFDIPQPHDIQFNHCDKIILVDKKQLMYVIDVELDFIDEADTRGFYFKQK